MPSISTCVSHLAVDMAWLSFRDSETLSGIYIMSKFGFKVTNYIDDTIGQLVCSTCHQSFDALLNLLIDFGFDISSKKKIVIPSTKVTCLGVDIDTVELTNSITPAKSQ